jgi:predicted CoA-binding protein
MQDPLSDGERIEAFLAAGPWAVVGASTDRAKYGNKVLRAYLQDGRAPLYAVNPREKEVEGVDAYPSLTTLPEPARAVSIITPPEVTEDVVHDAVAAGALHLWMQPGAESDAAVTAAEVAGLSVIAGGPCLLVVLGYRE